MSSSLSMTSLLQVDLTSLSPDVVVVRRPSWHSSHLLFDISYHIDDAFTTSNTRAKSCTCSCRAPFPRSITPNVALRPKLYSDVSCGGGLLGPLKQQEKLQMLFILSQKLLRSTQMRYV